MTYDMKDKVVVITGASRGIGKGLALAFAKENAKVVINYLKNKELAEKLSKQMMCQGYGNIIVQGDVSNEEDVSKLCWETVNTYNRVDVLINNAGITDDSELVKMSLSQWENVINTNLTGTFLCCREFLKVMIKQKYGKIINVASLMGQEGNENQVNYCVSKAGIIGLTKSLAKECGKHNVSVNAVCPGFIRTDLNVNNVNKYRNALARSVLPIDNLLSDTINFVLYLSSDMASGVSGRVFNLDARINNNILE